MGVPGQHLCGAQPSVVRCAKAGKAGKAELTSPVSLARLPRCELLGAGSVSRSGVGGLSLPQPLCTCLFQRLTLQLFSAGRHIKIHNQLHMGFTYMSICTKAAQPHETFFHTP